jgi:hypothetical protein
MANETQKPVCKPDELELKKTKQQEQLPPRKEQVRKQYGNRETKPR